MKLESLDHLAVTVRDVQRSVAWYADVLGLERCYPEWDIPVMLCAGSTALALFPANVPDPKPVESPRSQIAMRHVAFRVGWAMFLQAQEELRARGILFEFQDHDISHSIYFDDPDGHQLEITTYELV